MEDDKLEVGYDYELIFKSLPCGAYDGTGKERYQLSENDME